MFTKVSALADGFRVEAHIVTHRVEDGTKEPVGAQFREGHAGSVVATTKRGLAMKIELWQDWALLAAAVWLYVSAFVLGIGTLSHPAAALAWTCAVARHSGAMRKPPLCAPPVTAPKRCPRRPEPTSSKTEGDSMKIDRIYTRNVVGTSRETSIAEAAAMMRKFHVGTLLAMGDAPEQETVIGIVTDRDIVSRP
jgi:hypothetical protein